MSDIHKQKNIVIFKNINNRYSILSENNEFKNFEGLAIGYSDDLYEYNGNVYTSGHELKYNGEWVKVEDISSSKKLDKTNIKVYEPLHIDDTHTYISNNEINKNCLVLDEFAFVKDTKEFMKAAFPVISSAQDKKSSKIIIISTPNGMNDYYQIWRKAKAGVNDFTAFKIDWRDTPRTVPPEEFKKQEIARTDAITFEQEYGCVGPDTIVTIKMPDGEIKDVTLEELRQMLEE